jgi:hypothetical protein
MMVLLLQDASRVIIGMGICIGRTRGEDMGQQWPREEMGRGHGAAMAQGGYRVVMASGGQNDACDEDGDDSDDDDNVTRTM